MALKLDQPQMAFVTDWEGLSFEVRYYTPSGEVEFAGHAAVALALTRLLEAPGRAAIVTLGADGAMVARDGQTWHFPAPSVKVVDTTGAGDAFCGAFAACLAFGSDILHAAQAGVVAGSIAVTREGAQPSMPRREEIEALLAHR
ncbi:MAG: hypothetical protein C4345_09520 [Chloroflexota bacterium]